MLVVATEDELSEIVAEKLVYELVSRDTYIERIRRNGYGYLKSKMQSFCEIARRRPVFILADLDARACPRALIEDWCENWQRAEKLIFRVAVREIESWLLADRTAIAKFLNVSPAKITRDPETLTDPKAYLLSLAEQGAREVKNRLLPSRGSSAKQGLGYSDCLAEFVMKKWSPARAAECSDSLRKARERLSRWQAEF